MDAKVRGRSPRRNDKAWERFDSMKRKILNSKSPRRSDAIGFEEQRSQSHSPTRTGLKPEAPEFVPHSVQRDGLYPSNLIDSSQAKDDHIEDRSPVDCSRAIGKSSFSDASDAQKENFSGSSEPSKFPSSSSLTTLTQGQSSRFRFHVPNGERRKKTRSSNTSAMTSHPELAGSEGMNMTASTDFRSQQES